MSDGNRATFGLQENVACGLTYLLGWVSGLIFLLAEKDNKKVRFNALQSVIWFAFMSVVTYICGVVPFLGGLLEGAGGVIVCLSWCILVFYGFTGRELRIPVIGDAVAKVVYK
ncbi:MAG: hypothetical protein LBM16_03545 [Clostridiales bacterium]|jgi:uncharacterized membrane protein|nr:hypothetical protein [Clostridiales bacterium]